MKNYILFFATIIVAGNFWGCNKKEKSGILYDKAYIEEIKQVRKEASFFLGRNQIPGGTFAVAKEGKIIYSEAMGYASKDLDVPASRDTKFRIGEVSELFTSLVFYKMVEEGKLHPDSTVQHYLKKYPKTNHKLTLKHLLYNTSGIREPAFQEKDWRGLNISIEQGLDNFKNDSLMFVPGVDQIISIFNYNLLGAVMQAQTGKKYQHILKEYITDTLYLSNTLVDNPFATIKGRSDFFDKNLVARVVNATFRDMRYRAPSEGILSNAEDLVKFGNAILYSNLISDDIKDKLFQPLKIYGGFDTQTANGWYLLSDKNNRTIYGRKGSVTGGGAALIIYPEEKLVVAGAVNVTSEMDDIPVFQFADFFLNGVEKEDSPQ